MKRALVYTVVFICLSLLAVRFSSLASAYLFKGTDKSGLKVLSFPDGADVILEGQTAGKTPFENQELTPGEYQLKIQLGELRWQGKVALTAGAVTVLNRELSGESLSSSGEVLTLEKGQGATIISSPSQAQVEIDGGVVGKTPLMVELPVGEHFFVVSKENFLNRSIKAHVLENFNLTINVDMAVSETDLTNLAAPVVKESRQAVVLNTPTNFLRVREKPNLSAREISRVKPGDGLVLLEELPGWSRVRLPNDTEGYVASDYIEKK